MRYKNKFYFYLINFFILELITSFSIKQFFLLFNVAYIKNINNEQKQMIWMFCLLNLLKIIEHFQINIFLNSLNINYDFYAIQNQKPKNIYILIFIQFLFFEKYVSYNCTCNHALSF